MYFPTSLELFTLFRPNEYGTRFADPKGKGGKSLESLQMGAIYYTRAKWTIGLAREVSDIASPSFDNPLALAEGRSLQILEHNFQEIKVHCACTWLEHFTANVLSFISTCCTHRLLNKSENAIFFIYRV